MAEVEYPVRCRNCGFLGEEDVFVKGSLDAYADFDDYDVFCPHCDNDDLEFMRPREDSPHPLKDV